MAHRKDEDPWNYAVVHDKTIETTAAVVIGQQQAEQQPTSASSTTGACSSSTTAAPTISPSKQMVQLRAETWRAMEHAYRQGMVRAIGVSNFSIQHLQTLEKTATFRPMVNQVELHPLHPQNELLQYCQERVSLFKPMPVWVDKILVKRFGNNC
jgi:type 1 glutamine amidotransferase